MNHVKGGLFRLWIFIVGSVITLVAEAADPVDWNNTSHIGDRAVAVSRGFGYPGRSDASFSSRKYMAYADGDVHDTFAEAPYFFLTRFDWVYDLGNEGNIIPRAKAEGWRYTGAINSILPDIIGTSQRTLGRDKDIDGNFSVVGHLPSAPEIGDFWSEDYYDIAVEHLESMITNGADAIQQDDPGMNYLAYQTGAGGYGDATDLHFRTWIYANSTSTERAAWGLPSSFTTTYREWVVAQGGESAIDSELWERYELHLLEGLERYFSRLRQAARDLNNGVSIPFSCNYGSNVSWDETRIWSDFGMAETRMNNISAFQIRSWLRFGEALSKSVLLSPPRYDTYDPPVGYVDFSRKCVASTYALGGVMMVPWDVWQNVDGGAPRYYGTPAEYADLFGFIQAIPGYFDGYEEVFCRGEGIPISQFGFTATPMWFNGASTRVLGCIRSRVNQLTQPVMIHLVDWADTPQTFNVVLDPTQFFGDSAIKAHLYTPTSYSATNHQASVTSGSYSTLRQFQYLTPTVRADGRYQYTIPALSPWGILRILPN